MLRDDTVKGHVSYSLYCPQLHGPCLEDPQSYRIILKAYVLIHSDFNLQLSTYPRPYDKACSFRGSRNKETFLLVTT